MLVVPGSTHPSCDSGKCAPQLRNTKLLENIKGLLLMLEFINQGPNYLYPVWKSDLVSFTLRIGNCKSLKVVLDEAGNPTDYKALSMD